MRDRYHGADYRQAVSIHAPCCRGAMRASFSAFEFNNSFNPRSPLPGSDASERVIQPLPNEVSIHAPRCRGAMQAGDRRPCVDSRFQSTLPVAGERCSIARNTMRTRSGCFNPRSPLPGSDALFRLVDSAKRQCFNPRSPLPGSDAARRRTRSKCYPVSIHAPRCRGAMPEDALMTDLIFEFQSTLPVAGERCVAMCPVP